MTLLTKGIEFTQAAASNIEETAADVAHDITRLRSGGWTPAQLLAFCLDGAGDDRIEGWRDYVSAVSLAAGVEGSSEDAL